MRFGVMSKYLFSVIFVAVFLTLSGTVFFAYAEEADVVAQGECGATAEDNVKWSFTSDGTLTVYGNGGMKNYSYDPDAQAPWSELEVYTLIIGDGVTRIGDYAFNCHKTLMNVKLGKSLREIGEYSFEGCRITELVLSDSVRVIGEWAFSSCPELKRVEFGSGLEVIGRYAFAYCHRACFGEFGNKLREIGACAFDSCYRLSEVIIPDSVTYLGPAVFYESGLGSAVLGKGIKGVTYDLFYGCTGLSKVVMPEGITYISGRAFYGCSSLVSVNIPGTVTSIGDEAFAYCDSLALVWVNGADIAIALTDSESAGCLIYSADTVAVSSAITEVGGYVKESYPYADSVVNGGNAYSLYSRHSHSAESELWVSKDISFTCRLCGAVADIIGDNEYVAAGNCGVGVEWTLDSEGVLTVFGEGAMDGFEISRLPWARYKDDICEVRILEGVVSVGRCAFYGFEGIKKLSLPSGLLAIGKYAFYQCKGITEVILPESLLCIDAYAFRKTSLSEAVFVDASGWTAGETGIEITDPAVAAEYLKRTYYLDAWYRRSDDAPVLVDSGSFKKGFKWEFYSNGELYISGEGEMPVFSASSMPWYGYRDAVLKITVSEDVTSIGRCAFYGHAALREVALPDGIDRIGEYAFYGCANLDGITINGSVSRIGKFAFRKCKKMTSAVFEKPYGWSAGDDVLRAYELSGTGAAEYLTHGFYRVEWVRDVNAAEEDDGGVIDSGMSGYTVKWRLLTDGALVFSGNGEMLDYDAGEAPWAKYSDTVTAVRFEGGVTNVGRCAFYGFSSLESAELSETVESIGAYAFYRCKELSSISIPEKVTVIGKYAFRKSGVKGIILAVTDGWAVGDTSLEGPMLSDPVSAAEYLEDGYYSEEWRRGNA